MTTKEKQGDLNVYRAIIEVEVNLTALSHDAAYKDSNDLRLALEEALVTQIADQNKHKFKHSRVGRLHKLHPTSVSGRRL